MKGGSTSTGIGILFLAVCAAAGEEPGGRDGPVILLPLGRTAYQTNESIDVAVVRRSGEALAAGELELSLTSENGSSFTASFPVAAAPRGEAGGRRTEHLRLDARLLRPARYAVEVRVDGASAGAEIDVRSHVRKTAFRLIDWGGSGKGADQIRCGEDGSGFNLMYASYGGHDQDANIRGGIDYMRNCTMAGAHQMDGRLECDWSDPHVLAGGNARVARQALTDRRSGNVIGVHFYDEPGLTWNKHPRTGVFSPHNIPTQDWAFEAAWGRDAPRYEKVRPDDPASRAAWGRWLRWKQVFMEAAWRGADFTTRYVRADLLSATQSMYGWIAFGDGYYFNIVRPLPVMSGHGGYDDYAGGYLAPGFFFEMGRARDDDKPVWYLPGWWENSPSELFRLEQYLTFMMGAQGLAVPPCVRTESPGTLLQDEGVVEANRTMGRLGTIFAAMPLTRPDVAVLYSMSQNVRANLDSKDLANVQDFAGQVERLMLFFVAAKMSHIPVLPVVEEDVLDGTVAANHKALVLTGTEALDPRVVGVLEDWIAAGGHVILGDECKVRVRGAIDLGAEIHTRIRAEAAREFGSGDEKTRRARGCSARSALAYFREGDAIARAFAARSREIGILPVARIGEPQVFVARHAQGDVEYLFLVNAASDPEQVAELRWNGIRAARSDVSVPDDGRPLYDVLHERPAGEFAKRRGMLTARLRFGPGAFRAFARTARPVGGVQVFAAGTGPAFYARKARMNDVAIGAVVVDDAGRALDGAIPLAVEVVDPLGVRRFDLYRATERGVLRLDLPLGVNESTGEWTVKVRELLSGTRGSATFEFRGPAQCGALAGRVRRASYFDGDDDAIYRFFRVHRNIALVPGSSEHDAAQARRLAGSLGRWGISARIVPAADIGKKERPKEAFGTWCGAYENPDLDMPEDAAVLLGSPEDNPVIRTMAPRPGSRFHVLPYAPREDVFPGRGRGMVAWQTDVVSFFNYETITLIAHDAEGMAEAAGTLFEIASGYMPPTPWELPARTAMAPATRAPGLVPEARTVWTAALPDRAVTLAVKGNVIEALSLDGTVTRLKADGKVSSRKPGAEARAGEVFREITKPRPEPELDAAMRDATKVVKFVARGGGLTAVAYWGGWLGIFDDGGKPVARQMLPHDFAALAWAGETLIAALADGRLIALEL